MELKDVILSTLAEMEEQTPTENLKHTEDAPLQQDVMEQEEIQEDVTSYDNELYFLQSIRERLLVLFEGFQAPNNANIEAKVDMTLNFLEYTLATIDERVEKLEKGNHK